MTARGVATALALVLLIEAARPHSETRAASSDPSQHGATADAKPALARECLAHLDNLAQTQCLARPSKPPHVLAEACAVNRSRKNTPGFHRSPPIAVGAVLRLTLLPKDHRGATCETVGVFD